VENNKTGQLAGVIKENTGLDVDYKILKYDGRPFAPEDLCTAIRDIKKKKAKKIIVINGYQEAVKNLDEVKMRTFKVTK
jgi:2-oxoglutarate ferredoxin oxidoreductase subunit alpha